MATCQAGPDANYTEARTFEELPQMARDVIVLGIDDAGA